MIIRSRRQQKRKRWPFILLVICAVFFVGSLLNKKLSSFYLNHSLISPIPFALFNVKQTEDSYQKQLQTALGSNNIAVNSVQQSTNASYIAIMPGGSKILFSSKKNLSDQVSSLQLIRSRLTIEGKEFSVLDLRFDQPVIVFK